MKNDKLILLGIIIAVILTSIGVKMVMEKSEHEKSPINARDTAVSQIQSVWAQLGQVGANIDQAKKTAENARTSLNSTAANLSSLNVSGGITSAQNQLLQTALKRLDYGCTQIDAAKQDISTALGQNTSSNPSYMSSAAYFNQAGESVPPFTSIPADAVMASVYLPQQASATKDATGFGADSNFSAGDKGLDALTEVIANTGGGTRESVPRYDALR